MVDYSFIRFKDNAEEAKNIGNPIVANPLYNDFIMLSPYETYRQISNFDKGVFIDSNKIELIDDCGNVLKDISGYFQYEEIEIRSGFRQIKFELLPIGEDFGNTNLQIKITGERITYYSNPFMITDSQRHLTSYFEYKNYCDFMGIPYEKAQVSQSIRLKCYFDIPVSNNEFKDSYQIGEHRTISAKPFIKEFEKFQVDEIDTFTFKRLAVLLAHDIIYINSVRMTNKAAIKSKEREGNSNFFQTSFTAALDYNDKKEFDYTIFQGIEVIKYQPYGLYAIGSVIPSISIEFSAPVELTTGKLELYDNNDTLLQEFPHDLLTVNGNILEHKYPNSVNLPTNGRYYFKVTSGLVKSAGQDWKGVNNNSDWFYHFKNGNYDKRYYDSNYYFTD